ncbi:MAG: hypothetical protein NVS4B12_09270 [Ktedonobacteraceae bacterium]
MVIEHHGEQNVSSVHQKEEQDTILRHWYDTHHDEQGTFEPLLEHIATRFRLLGEPLRLKILAALASGERSAGELVTLVGASQPNVSKHLTALTQGSIVSRRKVGTSIYYTIADESVLALCDVVCASVRRQFAEQARELGMDTYHRSQETQSQ